MSECVTSTCSPIQHVMPCQQDAFSVTQWRDICCRRAKQNSRARLEENWTKSTDSYIRKVICWKTNWIKFRTRRSIKWMNGLNGVLGDDPALVRFHWAWDNLGYLIRWILLWIMPLLQDRSVDLLTSSPPRYHFSTDVYNDNGVRGTRCIYWAHYCSSPW